MFTPIKAWIIFAIIYLLTFIPILVVASFSGKWVVVTIIVLMIVTVFGFIVASWNMIPEKEVWIIHFMGKYTKKPLGAGLHLIFPMFTVLRSRTLVGVDQIMNLYLDENDSLGGGVVDFKDASAPVIAKVFFRIFDPVKSTYEIEDVFKGIEERIDSALRSFSANYTIDEAGSLKAYFNLGVILNGIHVKREEGQAVSYKDGSGRDITINENDCCSVILPDGSKVKPAVLLEIEGWGVEIKTIVITDVVLSDEIRAERRRVLEEAQKAQAAEFTKQKEITLSEGALQVAKNKADGEEYTFDRRGRGMREQLKKVTKAGLSGKEASDHITRTELYENIGDKAVILEAGGSAVGQGANIGAGAAAASSVVNNQNQSSPADS